jgi:hypothetical protein
MKERRKVTLALGMASAVVLGACSRSPRAGEVKDEALAAGMKADAFRAADEDYFHDMDGRVALDADEVKGRNTWIVWSAGNDRLWDRLSLVSAGALDFLKTLSSHPSLPATFENRWDRLGLINDPCFTQATGPDPNRFGLWLDTRKPECKPDPFEDESKYPGVRTGARGKNIPVGSAYGYQTGIVGLRLFPNPDFDEAAQKKWDPARYYTDKSYYESKDLVRPYRVGMSCGFCHVGPDPTRPPADRNRPKWENLASNVGAQFFWVDRIFYWSGEADNFAYQLFHTARPGTLDTSLVSTDSINNPRSMNAVYLLGPRLLEAKRWGKEQLAGGGLDNRQLNDYVQSGPLSQLFAPPATAWTPRVLKDGSDSVGAMGALNRVYLNIGTFSEEWLLHFNPLVGGKTITPIPIRTARENSAYFAATEAQTFNTAKFFLKSTGPHRLKDAPGGDRYLGADDATLTRGKVVFAETCARCHSSKLPEAAPGLDPDGCNGPGYLTCWNKYWSWTKTPEFKEKMRAIVLANDFLTDNFLSAEFRVPVTLLHTNACSPLATNAIAGNIWDNFSSQSYKDLPSVGSITWYHPITGERHTYQMPAGGRGYTRPASLVSLWSTAPYLQNNSVGPFDSDPSVDARMGRFQKSIEQMLWPEKREHDRVLGDRVPGTIDRTTQVSYVKIAQGYVPDNLRGALSLTRRLAPWLFDDEGLKSGPIPAGTPIGLISNLNLLAEDVANPLEHKAKLLELGLKIFHDLRELGNTASSDEAARVFANVVDPLLELSKCPDLVVNRGHYFGTGYVEPGETRTSEMEPGLSDDDKRALIEFLKTL